jgi:two-component system, NarL family, response regulator YdfI
MRVGVLARNLALRIGLRELLNGSAEIDVVAEIADLDELDTLGVSLDILVAAELAGAELRELADEADAALLLLTDERNEAQALSGSRLLAWGVLPVNATEDELLAAVHALGEGLWVGAPGLVKDLLIRSSVQMLSDAEPLIEPLTGREIEVLQLISQGLANKQIALELNISEHTVKFHLSSLYAKLGVSSRTEAIRAGMQRGLITL